MCAVQKDSGQFEELKKLATCIPVKTKKPKKGTSGLGKNLQIVREVSEPTVVFAEAPVGG
jgi:hypothetical protein